MLKVYLKRIVETSHRGDAREESYYSILEDLLYDYCASAHQKKVHVTTIPLKTEAGNPDFRVWDGKQHITGYIEAKGPSIEDLDRIEDTEQLKRYRHTFPNLILTNFLEFRLYRNGEMTDKVLIGRPVILNKLKTAPPVEKESELLQLLERFFSFSIPKVYNAKTLAIELAKRTRFLKDEVIAQELREEERKGKGFIQGFYEAFKDYLISSLTANEFSDLYAQTITYGLFAARTRSENGFNRKLAYDNIPKTIGILRDVFRFVSSVDLPQQMEWIIDDISEILSVTHINKILHEYFHEGKGKDPIVHFYETFLAKYDPNIREMRGVYYTPEPVVSYIVRSIHSILKEQFNKPDGFADKNVTVLDPAAGTLTFLAETARFAVEEFVSKYGDGGRKNFIQDHILKNFYAFEIMMAPYAIGHLKMSFFLEELGYRLQKDDRVKLYLTNTLEMEELPETKLPGMASLSEESHLAGKVKKEQPILVILGNPPYSGISKNMGKWIVNLIEDYKYVDGKHFSEKKHWLQDDYVKFIRFAQWKIENLGEGVLGFITNHSYLDNPTFRGMRFSLLKSFSEIYIFNLHGNSLKKEKCPDGSKDENVFDIQQGVALILAFKKKGEHKECPLYYSELFGVRDLKYDRLLTQELHETKWEMLNAKSPYYFFIPRNEAGQEEYSRFYRLSDIFPTKITGIVTARDEFVIDFDKSSLQARIQTFLNRELSDDFVKEGLKLKENYMWRVSKARKELMNDEKWNTYFTKILYRPFDTRTIYYHAAVVWRTRREVMINMFHDNLALISPKQFKEKAGAFVSDSIIGHKTVSAYDINYLFPLYLYHSKENKGLLGETKEPNIKPEIFKSLCKTYKNEASPEDIFYYIYAVLYSETYRTKYAEFLKIDFPRVPFTKDYGLFKKMSEYGNRLVSLHLLKSPELESPISHFQGEGCNKVEKPKYDEGTGRVYINKEQYFEGISQEVWSYQVGGYQVCDKWLKDRKERVLSLEEIKTYCRIVTAVQRTIEVQKAIDEIYENVEADVIALSEKLYK
jgi:hypothetical protein